MEIKYKNREYMKLLFFERKGKLTDLDGVNVNLESY